MTERGVIRRSRGGLSRKTTARVCTSNARVLTSTRRWEKRLSREWVAAGRQSWNALRRPSTRSSLPETAIAAPKPRLTGVYAPFAPNGSGPHSPVAIRPSGS